MQIFLITLVLIYLGIGLWLKNVYPKEGYDSVASLILWPNDYADVLMQLPKVLRDPCKARELKAYLSPGNVTKVEGVREWRFTVSNEPCFLVVMLPGIAHERSYEGPAFAGYDWNDIADRKIAGHFKYTKLPGSEEIHWSHPKDPTLVYGPGCIVVMFTEREHDEVCVMSAQNIVLFEPAWF